MVEGEAQRDDVAKGDAIARGEWLTEDAAHAEGGAFWVVDDWRKGVDPKGAEAGEGEGSAA